MDQQYPHIGVIILNWNGLADTLECLESLAKSDYPNFSLFVLDNASKEDELKAIKNFWKEKNYPIPAFFLQNEKNEGFAKGNNRGIEEALKQGADAIFTLNNDTVVDSHFLSAVVQEMKKDSQIGIIAPLMLNYYDRTKIDNTGHELLTTGDTIPRDRDRAIASLLWPTRQSLFCHSDNNKLIGACAGAALYSSSMLKEIGLFDEGFFLNYEDSDLSLRAFVSGWKIHFCKESIVYHKISASIKKIKNTAYRVQSQRNQLWAYFINTPLLVLLLNFPFFLFREFFAFLFSLLTFQFTVLKILFFSRLAVIKSLPMILKKRQNVLQHQKISSLTYWSYQRSVFSSIGHYLRLLLSSKVHARE